MLLVCLRNRAPYDGRGMRAPIIAFLIVSSLSIARAEEKRRQDADPPELNAMGYTEPVAAKGDESKKTQVAGFAPSDSFADRFMDSMYGDQTMKKRQKGIDEAPITSLPVLKPGEEAQRREHVKREEDSTAYPQTGGATVADPEPQGRRNRQEQDSIPDPMTMPEQESTPKTPTRCESMYGDCQPI